MAQVWILSLNTNVYYVVQQCILTHLLDGLKQLGIPFQGSHSLFHFARADQQWRCCCPVALGRPLGVTGVRAGTLAVVSSEIRESTPVPADVVQPRENTHSPPQLAKARQPITT